MRWKRSITAALMAAAVAACGGASDEPTGTTARPGESVGVADAIERAQQVADQAEDRLNQIDDLAPSP